MSEVISKSEVTFINSANAKIVPLVKGDEIEFDVYIKQRCSVVQASYYSHDENRDKQFCVSFEQ